jgi:hypothetical protein
LVGKLKGRYHYGVLDTEGRITLRQILRKQDVWAWIGFNASRQEETKGRLL